MFIYKYCNLCINQCFIHTHYLIIRGNCSMIFVVQLVLMTTRAFNNMFLLLIYLILSNFTLLSCYTTKLLEYIMDVLRKLECKQYHYLKPGSHWQYISFTVNIYLFFKIFLVPLLSLAFWIIYFMPKHLSQCH